MAEYTVPQIAEQAGCSLGRVESFIRRRGYKSHRRVGITRVFDQATTDAILADMRALDAKRTRGGEA